jgi:hypothetical protein
MMKSRFLNLFAQLATFIIITIAAIILFQYFITKVYFPVSVSIEMKSPEDNFYQLFYSATRGFSEPKSIRKSYRGGDSFDEISFELPNIPVNYLRFDPGEKPGSFLIKKIEIRVGGQSKVFRGEEVYTAFKVADLLRTERIAAEYLELKSTNSHDSQMQLIQPLEKYFAMAASKKLSASNYIVVALYLISVFLIMVWDKRIINFFLNFNVRQRPLSQPIIIKPTIFSIAVAVLICAKLFLVSAQQMTGITTAGHDDALFVKLAYNISAGNWLGAYDNLTLIKGFFYPFFIAFANVLGLRLFFAENLLYALAALSVVLALSPIMKSKVARILLFAVILFNPMSSTGYLTRVIREDIYTSLSMITLASFIAIFLARSEASFRSIRIWALIGGISLFAFWNTREEGIVLLPVFVFLTLLFLAKRYHMYRKTAKEEPENFSTITLRKSIIYALLPFMILLSGNFLVAWANYHHYGAFVINEMKSKAFSDAFAALSKIEQKNWLVNVSVSKESMAKAYSVSPTFAQLADDLDSKDNQWLNPGVGSPGEIKGGWTVWALRDAAQNKGHHSSLPESQRFYRQISDEINAAFEKGSLEKTANISFFGFTWDHRYFEPFIEILRLQLKVVTGFKGFMPYPAPLNDINTTQRIAIFQNMTREIVCTEDLANAALPTPSKLKFKLMILIGKVYQLINPFAAILSVLSFLLIMILMLIHFRKKWLWDLGIILSLLLYIILSRHALIASGTVSQWTNIQLHYLNLIYPFMLIFEFLAIWGACKYIMIIYKGHNSKLSPKAEIAINSSKS